MVERAQLLGEHVEQRRLTHSRINVVFLFFIALVSSGYYFYAENSPILIISKWYFIYCFYSLPSKSRNGLIPAFLYTAAVAGFRLLECVLLSNPPTHKRNICQMNMLTSWSRFSYLNAACYSWVHVIRTRAWTGGSAALLSCTSGCLHRAGWRPTCLFPLRAAGISRKCSKSTWDFISWFVFTTIMAATTGTRARTRVDVGWFPCCFPSRCCGWGHTLLRDKLQLASALSLWQTSQRRSLQREPSRVGLMFSGWGLAIVPWRRVLADVRFRLTWLRVVRTVVASYKQTNGRQTLSVLMLASHVGLGASPNCLCHCSFVMWREVALGCYLQTYKATE